MTPKDKCLVQIGQLNKELDHLREKMLGYPEEANEFQPDQMTWSPKQVCKHLQLSEHYSLKNLVFNLERLTDRPCITWRSTFNLFLLRLALASPFKFKAPAVTIEPAVAQAQQTSRIFEQWNAERNKLSECIRACPPEAFGKQVYKHPYAGYLTPVQMLRFFSYHFAHHLRQINSRLALWERTRME